MPGVTYHTGALIAAAGDHRTLWSLHRQSLERGLLPTVPAGVLARARRGAAPPALSRLLRGCRVEALTEQRAKACGSALARSGSSNVIDVAVVLGGSARGDLIITGDAPALQALGAALGIALRLVEI